MAKKTKKTKKQKSVHRVKTAKKKSSNQLTALDVFIAAVFIGSIIFTVIAFALAVHPINDNFVFYPLGIGGVAGVLVGLIFYKITRFESLWFMVAIMALSCALFAVGLVLTFNRPLDHSSIKHHFVKVINKFDQGGARNHHYFLEVEDFPLKRIDVEEDVYNGCPLNGKVDVMTRAGFFGFPYIEGTQLVGLDLLKTKKLPEVPPAMPVEDLPTPKK